MLFLYPRPSKNNENLNKYGGKCQQSLVGGSVPNYETVENLQAKLSYAFFVKTRRVAPLVADPSGGNSTNTQNSSGPQKIPLLFKNPPINNF